MKKYAPYIALAFEISAFLVIGFLIGKYFDEQKHSGGIYTAVGLFSGLGLWVVRMLISTKKL